MGLLLGCPELPVVKVMILGFTVLGCMVWIRRGFVQVMLSGTVSRPHVCCFNLQVVPMEAVRRHVLV